MPYRDPEKRRVAKRRYYAKNRDKILARLAQDKERKRPKHDGLTGAEADARRVAARERQRRWRQRNREHARAVQRPRDRARYAEKRREILSAKRERYASDPTYAEMIRASNRNWYARNREERREYRRRYRQEHGDEIRARERESSRRRYASDPSAHLTYYKQWRLRNLERARAYVRIAGIKRRAVAAGKHFTLAEWQDLLAKHDGCCAYCGSTERIEADHRIPLCRGGSNEIDNILPACRPCNRRKHRGTEEEFRALLERERAEREGH